MTKRLINQSQRRKSGLGGKSKRKTRTPNILFLMAQPSFLVTLRRANSCSISLVWGLWRLLTLPIRLRPYLQILGWLVGRSAFRPEDGDCIFRQNADISHSHIRANHGSIWAFTSTAVTLYADVFVYKTESCSNTMFRKKVLQAVCNILLVWRVYLHF
jgi:hypothetical protein